MLELELAAGADGVMFPADTVVGHWRIAASLASLREDLAVMFSKEFEIEWTTLASWFLLESAVGAGGMMFSADPVVED